MLHAPNPLRCDTRPWRVVGHRSCSALRLALRDIASRRTARPLGDLVQTAGGDNVLVHVTGLTKGHQHRFPMRECLVDLVLEPARGVPRTSESTPVESSVTPI